MHLDRDLVINYNISLKSSGLVLNRVGGTISGTLPRCAQ